MKVLFIPHNAYHTLNMSLAVPFLEKAGVECLFVNIDKVYHGENAETEMRNLHLCYRNYTKHILTEEQPDILVVMNDWGGVVKDVVLVANWRGVPTVAIIEGVQDFENTHLITTGKGPRRGRPYTRAKYQFLIGAYDRKFLGTKRVFVVGIPRMEGLIEESPVFPEEALVAINSNFTYGIYTDVQKEWIDGIVSACRLSGLDYVITQHHADRMDLSGYKVTDQTIHDVLRCCTVFVSRFSTCMLESMALGKPVIYHNPHGELMDAFQDPMGAFPITRNIEDLARVLMETVANPEGYRDRCRDFFSYHVSVTETGSAERIANAILAISGRERDEFGKVLPWLAFRARSLVNMATWRVPGRRLVSMIINRVWRENVLS